MYLLYPKTRNYPQFSWKQRLSEDCRLRDLDLLSQRRVQFTLQEFQIPEAFHSAEFLFRFQQPRGSPTQWDYRPASALHSGPLFSTVEKQDSMGLLEANVCRSSEPTPSRCTVRVSSSPSSRLRAALGLIRSSCRKILPSSALASALWSSGRCCGFSGPYRPGHAGQMLLHVPPLVNLAALYVGPLAEHLFDPRTQSLGPVDHEQVASVRDLSHAPPGLPTVLSPPWCSPSRLATIPIHAFPRSWQCPAPPPALAGRDESCRIKICTRS